MGRRQACAASGLVLLFLFRPGLLAAQWPGEVAGRVVDARTGEGVPLATVEDASAVAVAFTDGTGAFRLEGLDSGERTLRIRGIGYAPTQVTVEVRSGVTVSLVIWLDPLPIELPGVDVTSRDELAGGFVIQANEIGTAARTAGDVLRSAPGVVVKTQGPGGSETVSLRGGGSDAVLVMLDGVPLNDPVTGEADVSTVPADAVERITVLRGGRSASLGPRASSGAVLIETTGASRGEELRGSAGSLGLWSAGGTGSLGLGRARLALSGGLERSGGEFGFRRPTEAGGGLGRRSNADVHRFGLRAALQSPLAGGGLDLGLVRDDLERGLPGKSFAPSLTARQRLTRSQASVRWETTARTWAVQLTGFAAGQHSRFRDPEPPVGISYDDRTEVWTSGFRGEAVRAGTLPLVESIGVGMDAAYQRVASDALAAGSRRGRGDLGLFGSVRVPWPGRRGGPRLGAVVRAHRDGVQDRWHGSHELTISANLGGLTLHVAHRSSFSPPALGDVLFREGVAVAPNPALEAERVPAEIEAGASVGLTRGPVRMLAGAEAYRGDVRGMIVWVPDFRFVWRPVNQDVRRWGADVWGELTLAPSGLTLGGSYGLASVTYDWPEPSPPVQVVYRPRHSGQMRIALERAAASGSLVARYTGARNPVPTAVNALDAFWTVDVGLSRTWVTHDWRLTTSLDVRRLLNQKATLIYGFPDPGRTLRLGLRVRRRSAAASTIEDSHRRTPDV